MLNFKLVSFQQKHLNVICLYNYYVHMFYNVDVDETSKMFAELHRYLDVHFPVEKVRNVI